MSELDSIKSTYKKKKKRILKKVHFDFKGAHLAYTDMSQGGAASLKNEPYLLKASDVELDLTDEQKSILEEIGEESTPLEKKLSDGDDTNALSSSSEDGEGKLEKQEEDKMSEQISKELVESLEKQVAELKRENAVVKAGNLLTKYEFEAELNKGLAEAIADLGSEAGEVIIKAMDELVARSEAAVEKAVKESSVEEENTLAKALDEEQGHETVEEEVTKSLADRILEAKQKIEKGAK